MAKSLFSKPEAEQLLKLCRAVEEDDEDSWHTVRDWLKVNQSNEKLLAAAINNQEEGETCLHMIVKKHPPLDIVCQMIDIAPNVLRLPGTNKMLPLHIACKHAASVEVIHKLIQGAPITVRIGDCFSWLPIHFACANPNVPVDAISRLLRDASCYFILLFAHERGQCSRAQKGGS